MPKTVTKKTTKAIKPAKRTKRIVRLINATKPEQAIKTIKHVFILDASGSMSGIVDETIKGFNDQLQLIQTKAKEIPQEQETSLYTFSDSTTTKYVNRKAKDLTLLTATDYKANGNTALNDCIGKVINDIKADVGSRKDVAVIVTIVTDGYENASKEFSGPQIAALLSEVQEKDKYTITYIGANQDLHTLAKVMNLSPSNMMSYTSSKGGCSSAMNNMRFARSSSIDNIVKCSARGGDITSSLYSNENVFSPDNDTIVNSDTTTLSSKDAIVADLQASAPVDRDTLLKMTGWGKRKETIGATVTDVKGVAKVKFD